MLNWCNRFNICCFLDNHNYHLSHHSIECVLAAGATDLVSCDAGNAFSELNEFSARHKDWLFGHFGYDLKNETEQLVSRNPDNVKFPDLFFFVPEILIRLDQHSISIGTVQQHDAGTVWRDIQASQTLPQKSGRISSIQQRYTREEYVETVKKLKQHILRGDCYEINFCQEFYAENARIDMTGLYKDLSNSSPNPFSAFYRVNDLFLSCQSPERFLRKEGDHLLSQPIKGTSQRITGDVDADKNNASELANSEKERAENIMVVDLVRNDLSRICMEGSVIVDELCAVYSFPHVHQMISTISGKLKDGVTWIDAIRAAFPMGSMTGAPKKRVMEIIENYEKTKRGLFSGSIGYVTPDRDFDFNVVIRSVLYNSTNQYLSFHAGSAITFVSDPEKEYDECLLKAAAIKKALAETNTFH